jgi:hypothetical protein
VRLGEWNQPVQTLPSNGPDDALTDRVGHRALRRGLQYSHPEPTDRLVQMSRKDAVAIMDQVFVSVLIPHRLSQLLARPARARVGRHVAVNQPTASMFDHHEHIQQSERAGH